MAELRCPNCGKVNPADQELCQFCYTRLKPTGELPLSSSDDLMSLLGDQDAGEDVPEWLRDLGPEEKVSPFTEDFVLGEAGEEAFSLDFLQAEGEPPLAEEEGQIAPTPFSVGPDEADWLEAGSGALAGEPPLQEEAPESQAYEETLDWLSSLGEEGLEAESAGVPPAAEPEQGAGEDWLSQAQEPTPVVDSFDWTQPEEPAAAPGDQTIEEADWFSSLEAEFGTVGPAESAPGADFQEQWTGSAQEEQPDWLSRLGPEAFSGTEAETPEQPAPLEDEKELEMTFQPPEEQPGAEEWPSFAAGEAAEDGLPDWFDQLGSPTAGEAPPQAEPEGAAASVSPFTEGFEDFFEGDEGADWFASGEAPEEQPLPALEEDLPDWLRDAGEGESPFGAFQAQDRAVAAQQQEPAEPAASAEEFVPSWLQEPEEGLPAGEELESETSFATFEVQEEAVPDWLNRLDRSPDEIPAAEPVPAFVVDEELPPFGGEELMGAEAVSEGAEAQFGEAPDWLDQISASQELAPVETAPLEVTPEEEDLAPAELPGWLEAMRPSESAAPFRDATDDRVESQGVLAGMPGILAAEYDLERVRKPPTYSIKLQVPQEQQERLDLLKGLLAEEEQVAPLTKPPALPTTYILRLLILGAFVLGAVFAFWAGARQTPIPQASAVPQPAVDLSAAVDRLPNFSAVLVVFDYEPGSIPEMETAALGVVDQLLTKGSVIRTVSTNTMGLALAKRLLDRTMAMPERLSQPQPDIAHLGFIAGGPSGLKSFARDPAGLMRYDMQSTDSGEMDAWQAPALNPEAGLASFALVLVITDNGESARTWIEQVGPALIESQVPLLMVVSAQVEPLVLPYYYTAPRQVAGVAAGVMGGVYLESLSERTGPAVMLMDAYSLTLAVAVVLILIGSLVYLVSGQLKLTKNLRNEGQA
jgi:hypothetical protein